MANMKSMTARMDNLLATSSGSLKGTLANFETISDTIAASSTQIKSMIANADGFAEKMNNLDDQLLQAAWPVMTSSLTGTPSAIGMNPF